MERGTVHTSFQRKTTARLNGQQVHEKMVSITNHWENTNKNHNEISLLIVFYHFKHDFSSRKAKNQEHI